MEKKLNKVNSFWESYRDGVIESGVKENAAQWYVSWAQGFARSLKGKPLNHGGVVYRPVKIYNS